MRVRERDRKVIIGRAKNSGGNITHRLRFKTNMKTEFEKCLSLNVTCCEIIMESFVNKNLLFALRNVDPGTS